MTKANQALVLPLVGATSEPQIASFKLVTNILH